MEKLKKIQKNLTTENEHTSKALQDVKVVDSQESIQYLSLITSPPLKGSRQWGCVEYGAASACREH
jgi:hypothetical protein